MRAAYGMNEYSSSWRNYLRGWYNHALTNLRVTEGMKVQLQHQQLYAFQEYVSEARAFFQYGEGKREVIRPDGLIVIGGAENPEENLGLLLETENSVAKYRSIKAKLDRYHAVLGSSIRKEKYNRKLMLDEPVQTFVPVFVTSSRISPEGLLHKLKKIKKEHPDLFTIQGVFLATQHELSTNCFGEIFYNLSSEDPEEKRALFKIEGGHET